MKRMDAHDRKSLTTSHTGEHLPEARTPLVGPEDRLDSWKLVAGFLGCDARTAMRWAKERGLPVRRFPGGGRTRVYALRSELSAWLASAADQSAAEEIVETKFSRRWVFILAGAAVLLLGAVSLRLFRSANSRPSRLEFTADSFRVLSGAGDVLWAHKFPGLIDLNYPPHRPIADLGRVEDLLGDGNREILVGSAVRLGADPRTEIAASIDCFLPSGKLLWSYQPHVILRFGTTELNGPWNLDDLLVSQYGRPRQIYALFSHAVWGNAFVVRIDPVTGRTAIWFVNTGSLFTVNELATPKTTYLVVGGFNNEYDGGSLALIDERKKFAASPQTAGTRHACESCAPGMPDYYLVFPRSELSKVYEDYDNSVISTQVRDGELEVRKRETENGPTQTYYLLRGKPGSFVASLRFDSRYEMRHRELETAGRITHSLDACPDRMHPAPIRVWTPTNGWSAVQISRAQ